MFYLKDLCQLHFFVVENGVDTVDGLLGLMRCAPLGFLMQDGNQSPDGQIENSQLRLKQNRSCGQSLLLLKASAHSSLKNQSTVISIPLFESDRNYHTIVSAVALSQSSAPCS